MKGNAPNGKALFDKIQESSIYQLIDWNWIQLIPVFPYFKLSANDWKIYCPVPKWKLQKQFTTFHIKEYHQCVSSSVLLIVLGKHNI